MRSRRRAFTLVELLVVIGIITLLVALLMPALGKVRKHAWEVNCAANLRTIRSAVQVYVAQHGGYPSSTNFEAQMTQFTDASGQIDLPASSQSTTLESIALPGGSHGKGGCRILSGQP